MYLKIHLKENSNQKQILKNISKLNKYKEALKEFCDSGNISGDYSLVFLTNDEEPPMLISEIKEMVKIFTLSF